MIDESKSDQKEIGTHVLNCFEKNSLSVDKLIRGTV